MLSYFKDLSTSCRVITPSRLTNLNDANLAKCQLEKARQTVSTKTLESEIARERLMTLVAETKEAASIYDTKVQEVICAEAEVAKWRTTLNNHGLCNIHLPGKACHVTDLLQQLHH